VGSETHSVPICFFRFADTLSALIHHASAFGDDMGGDVTITISIVAVSNKLRRPTFRLGTGGYEVIGLGLLRRRRLVDRAPSTFGGQSSPTFGEQSSLSPIPETEQHSLEWRAILYG
jgi:hypothetical protein